MLTIIVKNKILVAPWTRLWWYHSLECLKILKIHFRCEYIFFVKLDFIFWKNYFDFITTLGIVFSAFYPIILKNVFEIRLFFYIFLNFIVTFFMILLYSKYHLRCENLISDRYSCPGHYPHGYYETLMPWGFWSRGNFFPMRMKIEPLKEWKSLRPNWKY